MRVIGLVPARAGSKGLPGKNSRPLLGKSLVERACESARDSGVLHRLLVSTDDPTIAEQARRAGAEVPFLRPAALARDDTPMIDVALHALEFLTQDDRQPDALLLLQPTSPLRTSAHIQRAVDLLIESGGDAVCSVTPVPLDLSPHYVMRIDKDGFLRHFLPEGTAYTRRQDVPRAFKRDGTIFLTRVEALYQHRDFYGDRCVPMLLDQAESVSIDTADQWEDAERILRHRRSEEV